MTPATKAPIAIESPASSINNPEPNTTKSAAAVITSRALELARILKTGFRIKRPMKTNAPNATIAISADCHQTICDSRSKGDKNVITANKGTISKSSNNKIETIFCPGFVESALRSPSTCITIAVDVNTKPDEQTKATSQDKPN